MRTTYQFLITISFIFILSACGGGSSESTDETDSDSNNDVTASPSAFVIEGTSSNSPSSLLLDNGTIITPVARSDFQVKQLIVNVPGEDSTLINLDENGYPNYIQSGNSTFFLRYSSDLTEFAASYAQDTVAISVSDPIEIQSVSGRDAESVSKVRVLAAKVRVLAAKIDLIGPFSIPTTSQEWISRLDLVEKLLSVADTVHNVFNIRKGLTEAIKSIDSIGVNQIYGDESGVFGDYQPAAELALNSSLCLGASELLSCGQAIFQSLKSTVEFGALVATAMDNGDLELMYNQALSDLGSLVLSNTEEENTNQGSYDPSEITSSVRESSGLTLTEDEINDLFTKLEDLDNDGAIDILDRFPSDFSEWSDTDEDGIGNNSDPDDDNDGVSDTFDTDPLVALPETDTSANSCGLTSITSGDSGENIEGCWSNEDGNSTWCFNSNATGKLIRDSVNGNPGTLTITFDYSVDYSSGSFSYQNTSIALTGSFFDKEEELNDPVRTTPFEINGNTLVIENSEEHTREATESGGELLVWFTDEFPDLIEYLDIYVDNVYKGRITRKFPTNYNALCSVADGNNSVDTGVLAIELNPSDLNVITAETSFSNVYSNSLFVDIDAGETKQKMIDVDFFYGIETLETPTDEPTGEGIEGCWVIVADEAWCFNDIGTGQNVKYNVSQGGRTGIEYTYFDYTVDYDSQLLTTEDTYRQVEFSSSEINSEYVFGSPVTESFGLNGSTFTLGGRDYAFTNENLGR